MCLITNCELLRFFAQNCLRFLFFFHQYKTTHTSPGSHGLLIHEKFVSKQISLLIQIKYF